MIKVVKHETSNGYVSVLLKTKIGGIWMDVDPKVESADWNQYIFFTSNSSDLEVKNFQEDCDNFMECSSTALDYVERLLK